MAVSEDYLEYIQEQLRELGTVTFRKMFGGAGLYYRGLFFALIDDDVFYLKTDLSNRKDFESVGMKPFRPFAEKPAYAMNYHEVPPETIENPDELAIWAKKSIAIASKTSDKKRLKTASKRKK